MAQKYFPQLMSVIKIRKYLEYVRLTVDSSNIRFANINTIQKKYKIYIMYNK